MEAFKLPLREVGRRYTKSDMLIACWDSRLKSYNLSPKGRQHVTPPEYVEGQETPVVDYSSNNPNNGVVETEDSYKLPSGVNNGVQIPKKFFNGEGEVDLRNVKGDEAVRYLRALGLNIAPIIKM